MSPTLDQTYKRVQGFPWQQIEDQSLILNTDQKMAHELNSPGSLIWNLLDGSLSLEQVSEKVCAEYEVELKEAQDDVIELVTQLSENKLVQCL